MVARNVASKLILNRVWTTCLVTNLSETPKEAGKKNLLLASKSEWAKKEDIKWNPKRNKFAEDKINETLLCPWLHTLTNLAGALGPAISPKVFRHWHCIEVVICDYRESNLRHFPTRVAATTLQADCDARPKIFHFSFLSSEGQISYSSRLTIVTIIFIYSIEIRWKFLRSSVLQSTQSSLGIDARNGARLNTVFVLPLQAG